MSQLRKSVTPCPSPLLREPVGPRAAGNSRPKLLRQRRRGAMLILVAVMMVILLGMAAFSVDVAYMELVHTQLRTATDAAARAGSEALVRTQSEVEARDAAKAAAARNLVANQPLLLADSEIEFGHAVPNGQGVFEFGSGVSTAPVNAVRVEGRRTRDSLGGSVPLFMGGFLGRRAYEPTITSTSTSITRDIALVLDRSGSMLDDNKIGDLKSAVNIFLNILDATSNDERISLTTYSTFGTKNVAMTSNFGPIRRVVNGLLPEGFTAIGQGLQIGSNSLVSDPLSRPLADKTIVLMTDGIENRPPFVNVVVPGVITREQVVHTITFGRDADQNRMRLVAEATGGIHQHANNGEELREAFRTIARTLAVVLID